MCSRGILHLWTVVPGTVALMFNNKYEQKESEKKHNVIRYSWKSSAGRSKRVRYTTGAAHCNTYQQQARGAPALFGFVSLSLRKQ